MPKEDVNFPQVKGGGKVVAPKEVGQDKPPSFVEDMMTIRRQKMAEKMVSDEFGSENAKKGNESSESIQSTIVNKSLEQAENASKRVEKLLETKEEEVAQARKEADDAKAALYTIQFEQIKSLSEEMKKAIEELKAGGEPKTALGAIKEAEALVEHISHYKIAQENQGAGRQVMMPPELELQLTQMKHAHELALKKMDLEIARLSNEHNLKLLEFQEESNRRWAEYKDNQGLRNSGLQALSDLSVAISSGIQAERGDGPPDQKRGSNRQTRTERKSGASPKPSVQQAVCEDCQSPINIPEGATSVECPECGATYDVNPGG